MKTRLSALLSAAILVPAAATPAFANSDEAAMIALPLASSVSTLSDVSALSEAFREDAAATITAPQADSTAISLVAPSITAEAAAIDVTSTSSANVLGYAAATQSDSMGGTGGRSDKFSIMLNQDSFFGFYPTFNGLIPVSENVDFSFYGILWTTPSFSFNAPSGSGLWTEFGVGAAFYAADGDLVIKPQIGITNGSLLSGGAGATAAGAIALDGIVPNLTVNYANDSFELEYYGGYYAALRGRGEDASLDFVHTWVNFGYKATDNFSFGPHYELLANTRNTYPGGSASNTYSWLGGYIQFALDNGFFARFTTGADLNSGNAGDFYKLGVGFSF